MTYAAKLALIWVTALLCGWLFRSTVPVRWMVVVPVKHAGIVLPINRLAFWLCILVAYVISLIPLFRLFMRDLSIADLITAAQSRP